MSKQRQLELVQELIELLKEDLEWFKSLYLNDELNPTMIKVEIKSCKRRIETLEVMKEDLEELLIDVEETNNR